MMARERVVGRLSARSPSAFNAAGKSSAASASSASSRRDSTWSRFSAISPWKRSRRSDGLSSGFRSAKAAAMSGCGACLQVRFSVRSALATPPLSSASDLAAATAAGVSAGERRCASSAASRARPLSPASAAARDKGRAREAALEAHRLSPALTPAAVAAAKSLAEESGGVAKAERTLKRTWRQAPHPDIAAAFADLKPDESPSERRERFQGLIAENRDHVESRLLEAELALAAEDFPAALKALGDLAESRPTTRSLAIMAAAERGSGSPDHVVRGWLAKALSAPRGERWVCEACGSVQDEWGPVCDECRAVDSLVWKQPEGAGESKAAETALLPVILGSLAAEEGRRRRPDAEDAET